MAEANSSWNVTGNIGEGISNDNYTGKNDINKEIIGLTSTTQNFCCQCPCPHGETELPPASAGDLPTLADVSLKIHKKEWDNKRSKQQEKLQSCSLWKKNHIHRKIDKMKRQRAMYQMKEQDKTPEKQLNEGEIGNLPEK